MSRLWIIVYNNYLALIGVYFNALSQGFYEGNYHRHYYSLFLPCSNGAKQR